MTCNFPRICLAISSQGRHRSLIEHFQPAQPCQSTWHTHFISFNLTKPHSIGYYYSHCTDGKKKKKRLEKLNQLAQSKHLINDRAAHFYPLNHGLSTADNFHTLLFFFFFFHSIIFITATKIDISLPDIGIQYLCYSVWKLFEKSRYYETFLTISAKTDYPSIPKIDYIKKNQTAFAQNSLLT